MYAIVDIAGQQLKVEKDQEILVNRLAGDDGSKVEFDQVLLIDDKGKVKLGEPIIKGATVTAKILSQEKGDKVLVFKKKRRKGYKLTNGHRQQYTKIKIEKITATAKKAAAKKEEKPEETKAD